MKWLKAIFGIKSARAASLATVSAAAIYSGFYFSERSLINLQYVNPQMQAVANCAIQRTTVDFVVYHGLRSEAEQRSMIARGVSWVNRSRHQDGDAIDIMALKNGKGTWQAPPYNEIAKAFYSCGEDLGFPVTWGGEWRVKDLVHFELKRVE
jgi:peptidoglycan L-alanyl-D-glutamate endopeptidase CwlK